MNDPIPDAVSNIRIAKAQQRLYAFVFGVVFVVAMLVLAIFIPNPTAFQYTVFRIVLALAAGGVVAMFPGFITAQVANSVRAGGALAVFVVVYFFSPASLVKSEKEIEIDKPLVRRVIGNQGAAFDLFISAARAGSVVRQDVLKVSTPEDLLRDDVLAKRYDRIIVDNVRATVPSGSVIVANDIEGIGAGSFAGPNFTIVSRRLANISVDASGDAASGEGKGNIALYVKMVSNTKLIAHGADGRVGTNGADGARGADGGNGRDGSCDGFGGYRGADAGGDGRDGADGERGEDGGNGKAGGTISLMTIGQPFGVIADVGGGQGGAAGNGGRGGLGGRGGKGGSGCVGLGGSQTGKPGGRDGLPGKNGQNGKAGIPGAQGTYRLRFVDNFDKISEALAANSNETLVNSLAAL